MKREDDEQLWDLLGRGSQPELSPFFARNVLRRIRQEPNWLSRFRSWLSWRRLVPASGLAAAVIAALFFFQNLSLKQDSSTEEVDLLVKIEPQDYEVVADLDELLASDENNPWDESSSL